MIGQFTCNWVERVPIGGEKRVEGLLIIAIIIIAWHDLWVQREGDKFHHGVIIYRSVGEKRKFYN